jgi:hypothetical protein
MAIIGHDVSSISGWGILRLWLIGLGDLDQRNQRNRAKDLIDEHGTMDTGNA